MPEEKEVEEAAEKAEQEKGIEELSQEVEKLKKALKEEQKKSESYLTSLKYLQADFENYRKRVQKEVEETVKLGNERIILGLLDVKGDLARAIEEGEKADNKNSILEGVKMILTKLDELLKKEGVAKIEAMGKPFDPKFHEAVGYVEREDFEDNIIISEVRQGYTLHGKVIRPSLVEVARKPKLEQKPAEVG